MGEELTSAILEPGRADRAMHVEALLADLMDLHRSWNSFLEDKWQKDELDFSCFFEPERTERTQDAMMGDRFSAPADFRHHGVAPGGAPALPPPPLSTVASSG